MKRFHIAVTGIAVISLVAVLALNGLTNEGAKEAEVQPQASSSKHHGTRLGRPSEHRKPAASDHAQPLPPDYSVQKRAEVAGGSLGETVQYLDEIDKTTSGSERAQLYKRCLEVLAEKEPEKALELCRRLGVGMDFNRALFGIMNTWSRNDPLSAAKAASSLDYPEEKKLAFASLAMPISKDPNIGVDILSVAGLDKESASTIATLVGRKMEGSTEEILSKVGSDSQSITDSILEGRAISNSEELLQYATKNSVDLSEKGLSNLAESLSRANPRNSLQDVAYSTTQWKQNEKLAGMIFGRWMYSNSIEASAWLNQYQTTSPNSQMSDQLTKIIVSHLVMKKDVSSAVRYAEMIKDPKLKIQVNTQLNVK